MTSPERDARIRALLARTPAMTNEERLAQRESFAYGNVKIDEPTATREVSLGARR